MNFIKDVKDLHPKEQFLYNDEKVGQELAESIQYYVDRKENDLVIYEKSNPKNDFDWMYEYIKRHKKELKQKGYKISTFWPPSTGYTISWRVKND